MADKRDLRRQFLTMVARRQRPGAGSILGALDGRNITLEWWTDVEQALQAIPHAVAGAVATNAYAPPRATGDLDMVVAAMERERAAAALQAAAWRHVGSLGGIVQGSAWEDAEGHHLDLIELSEPWATEAITAAQGNRIAGLPTMPLSYLVHMKLMAGRTGDLFDVSRMLGRASEDQTQRARAVVNHFGNAEDLADFEQLVRMGRLEREPGSLEGSSGSPP
ncbi:MAG: hypothetical protein ACR2JC_04895 [Chloroflexota bacterium]